MKKVKWDDVLAAVSVGTGRSLPCLREIKVKGGRGYATDLEHSVDVPLELPDGVYQRVDRQWLPGVTAPDDFPLPAEPEIVGGERYTLRPEAVKTMVEGLAFVTAASSKDESRMGLSGVLLEIKGGRGRLVAADGKRMHLVELGEVPGKFAEVNLTGKTLKLLSKAWTGGEVWMDWFPKRCLVFFDQEPGVRVTAKTIDHPYPGYRQVIPDYCAKKPCDLVASFDVEAFAAAVKELLPYAKTASEVDSRMMFSGEGGSITLKVVSGERPELNQSRSLSAVLGGKLEACYNGRYLLELTKVLPGVLHAKAEAPAVFAGADGMAIIMPIRVE